MRRKRRILPLVIPAKTGIYGSVALGLLRMVIGYIPWWRRTAALWAPACAGETRKYAKGGDFFTLTR